MGNSDITCAARGAEYLFPNTACVLDVGGHHHFRVGGEAHLWNPKTIASLQRAVRLDEAKSYEEFSKLVNDYTARTQRPMSHVRNYFDCIKSRQLTVANPEVMHRSMSTVHAANICMWLKRDMKYDPVREEFVNDAEANRLRARGMRAPWII